MKFALPLLVFLFAITTAFADELGPRDLDAFLVFTKGGITSARSDFQGNTGAGGLVQLTDFLVNGSLLTGDHVQFLRGTINGTLYSAKASRLAFATARYSVRNPAISERTRFLSEQMDTVAARISAMPATAQARRSAEGPSWRLDVTAARGAEVVDVSAEQLAGVQNLYLHGNGEARLFLRLHGADVRLVGGFFVDGIRPSQVLFFFPEAAHVTLGGGGAPWGIPGSVLAPCAAVDFSRALLTGQLYAGELRSEEGGQVNAGVFELFSQLLVPCVAGCLK